MSALFTTEGSCGPGSLGPVLAIMVLTMLSVTIKRKSARQSSLEQSIVLGTLQKPLLQSATGIIWIQLTVLVLDVFFGWKGLLDINEGSVGIDLKSTQVVSRKLGINDGE